MICIVFQIYYLNFITFNRYINDYNIFIKYKNILAKFLFTRFKISHENKMFCRVSKQNRLIHSLKYLLMDQYVMKTSITAYKCELCNPHVCSVRWVALENIKLNKVRESILRIPGSLMCKKFL